MGLGKREATVSWAYEVRRREGCFFYQEEEENDVSGIEQRMTARFRKSGLGLLLMYTYMMIKENSNYLPTCLILIVFLDSKSNILKLYPCLFI